MLEYYEAKQFAKDVLGALVNNTCPYCHADNLVKDFVSDDDIDKFVREHHLVIVVSGRPGV